MLDLEYWDKTIKIEGSGGGGGGGGLDGSVVAM